MDKFSKIDALLQMFLDKDNKFTVRIDDLIKTMKENHMKLPSNIKQWKKIVGVKPKFENIEYLLEIHEYLQKLGGSPSEGINLAIRIDNLSMFRFYYTGFPHNFLRKCCNLHSKNIIPYLLNIYEVKFQLDIDYLLQTLLENINYGVTKEIKDLIYNKIKIVVERNSEHENLIKILNLATDRKKSYDLYGSSIGRVEHIEEEGEDSYETDGE